MRESVVRVAAAGLVVLFVILLAFVPIPGASEGFRGVIIGALIAGLVTIGSEWLRGEREAGLDSVKRSNDRRIDRGRAEADTLHGLQEGLVELRLALGRLHRAMQVEPSPPTEVDAYTIAKARVDLHASRALADPIREAAGKAGVFAALVASTTDPSARAELLGEAFEAINRTEALVGPALRETIRDGYWKDLDRPR